LAGLGGFGWETGRLKNPLGLTIDFRGWLYVADSGNHRVQVVRPEDGSVVAVMGSVDTWGRPVAGTTAGAMTEPVHAVVNPGTCQVYVVDRAAGLIHKFDHRFEHLASFEPQTVEPPTLTPRRAGAKPRPVAVAVLEDSSILVFDTSRPRLTHMTPAGHPLPDVAFHSIPNPFQGGRRLPSRFRTNGEALLGPLDGQEYDQKWHRVLLEAEVPKGTCVEIQTYASNDSQQAVQMLPWAPVKPVAIASEEIEGDSREYQRLVLSDVERWKRSTNGSYLRDKPVLLEFTGDGPSSAASLVLPASAAGKLRAGDNIEFDTGASVEHHTIAAIADREVEFTMAGKARLYGPGTRVQLVERDGQPMPGEPRLIGELQMKTGADRIWLVIERLSLDNVHITLAAPVSGDFSTCKLRLVNTPGRLVARKLVDFEVPTVLHEPITVMSADRSEQASILLVEPDHHTVWLEPGTLGAGLNFEDWEQFTTTEGQPTDRGRFLWIRLRLFGRRERPGDGHGVESPSIFSVRAIIPRLSYLNYLPAIYARRDSRNDPSGALLLERLLAMFEGKLTHMESAYESVSRLLNPEAANEEWLQFLSAWLGLVFDPSWPLDRKRQLVLEAADLYKRRGTPESLKRYVEIYTGKRPALLEGFQWRPSSALVVGRAGRVGCSTFGGQSCNYQPYAHRFTLFVFLDEACDQEAMESTVRSIVKSVIPAHIEYNLCFVLPQSRVGLQSTVGLDMVLGASEPHPFVLGQGLTPLAGRVHPVIGLEPMRGAGGSRRAAHGVHISRTGVRCDQGFILK
jgi:phage tail-like protein